MFTAGLQEKKYLILIIGTKLAKLFFLPPESKRGSNFSQSIKPRNQSSTTLRTFFYSEEIIKLGKKWTSFFFVLNEHKREKTSLSEEKNGLAQICPSNATRRTRFDLHPTKPSNIKMRSAPCEPKLPDIACKDTKHPSFFLTSQKTKSRSSLLFLRYQ